MKPVFCLGDICTDLVLPFGAVQRAKRGEAVSPEETDVIFRHGGSVANTVAGLCALQIPVQFCGTVGNDPYGHTLIAELERLGADTSCVAIDSAVPTLLIAIIVDETGERTALATHRTHASQHQITAKQLPADLTDQVGWLHCGGVLLREEPAASVQLEAMQRCFEAGIPVSLDINARVESRRDSAFLSNLQRALRYTSVLFGSREDELPLLCGSSDEASIRSLTEGGRIVVARSGSRGATVYSESETIPCPAFSVPVVDTIGAGDAYDAGFIASRLLGSTLKASNRIANATAAYCVMHAGGRACPERKALERFLKEHPNESSVSE